MAEAAARHALLVEDEPEARTVLAGMLESLGWDVLAMGTGGDALRVVGAGIPIDALIIETTQAWAGGRSVVGAVVRRWPAVRVVVTARALSGSSLDAARARVLVKPITVRDLAVALARGQPR
jgi:CheY-like chemotaxis protein